MTVSWSSHAKGQRAAILRTIARELSREDASRWNMKIRDAVQHLADFPEAGDSIPETCFFLRPGGHRAASSDVVQSLSHRL